LSPIRVVFEKELTDALRDRRSLLSALLFGPMFGPIVFATLLTTSLRVEQERAEQPLSIPVIGRDRAPNLIAFLESNGAVITAPPADPLRRVQSEEIDLVLVIPAQYPKHFQEGEPAEVQLIIDRSRRGAQSTIDRVTGLLSAYGQIVGRLRLQIRGVDPSTVDPIVIAERDLSTPQSRGALLFSMLPYLVMMAVFIGSMYLAIDSTAGERERRSLEPLLINPVPRSNLMTGKLLATTLLGVVSLTLTVVTFAIAISFVPAGELGLRLELDPSTASVLFLVALPVTPIASSCQIIIAAFTKSFREAQTYVSLLLVMPMIPSFWLMLFPVKAKLWMMAIPLLAQNVLIEKLVRGEGVDLSHLALATFTTSLFGLVLWGVSASLYRREGLLFTE
jgi:sodium transport system permease protein